MFQTELTRYILNYDARDVAFLADGLVLHVFIVHV